jgi:hemoglobin/transferrin/lactoferrin receptor protein
VDVDSLKSVEIIKGADSISAGSGALGGAVVFTTKDPSDYLKRQRQRHSLRPEDRLHQLQRREVTPSPWPTGHRHRRIDADLDQAQGPRSRRVLLAHRHRHRGSGRRTPDPIDTDSTNVLAKIELVPSPAHRFGLTYERNRADNLVDNLSRVSAPGYMTRVGDDSNDRDRYGLTMWMAGNAMFDTLEAHADHQATKSYGITRITTGSGTRPIPPRAA